MKEYRDDLSFVISGFEKGEVSFRLLHINIDSLDEGVNDSENSRCLRAFFEEMGRQ